MDHGESKLRNRVVFKLTGRWPQSVVESRLTNTTWDPSAVNSLMRSVYEDAGRPVPPEYLDDRPRLM
jgi:hypothetical protein